MVVGSLGAVVVLVVSLMSLTGEKIERRGTLRMDARTCRDVLEAHGGLFKARYRQLAKRKRMKIEVSCGSPEGSV